MNEWMNEWINQSINQSMKIQNSNKLIKFDLINILDSVNMFYIRYKGILGNTIALFLI